MVGGLDISLEVRSYIFKRPFNKENSGHVRVFPIWPFSQRVSHSTAIELHKTRGLRNPSSVHLLVSFTLNVPRQISAVRIEPGVQDFPSLIP